MVQVLPGFDAQLGQNLASIIGAVNNVIDPDYEVKQMIRQKTLSDPNYAQSLANFAYLNPDFYKKLGLGKVGDVIGGISPDLKTVMQEAQKGYVADAAKNGSKELKEQAGQRELFGKTEAELRMDKLRETQAGLNIALAKQSQGLNEQKLKEGEAALQQLELEQKGVIDALGNYEGLKGLNLAKTVSDFVDGKADANVMSQLMSTPQLAKAVQTLLQVEQQKRSLRNQLAVAQYSRSLNRRSIAEEMTLRTRAGTPALWEKYMSDEATGKRLMDIVADPKKVEKPEDMMLLQMYNALNEKQNGTNARAAMQANMRAAQLIGLAGKKDADVDAIANQLNVVYQQLGEATGNYYEAKIDNETVTPFKEGWFRDTPATTRKRLKIIDLRTMEEVEPSRSIVSASGAPGWVPPQNYTSHEGNKFTGTYSPTDKANAAADSAAANSNNDFNETKVNDAIGKLQKSGLDKASQLKQIQNSKKLTSAEKMEIIKKLGL